MKLLDSHVHLFSQKNALGLHGTDSPINSDCTVEKYLTKVSESVDYQGLVVIEADALTGDKYSNNGSDIKEFAVTEVVTWSRFRHGEQEPGELIAGTSPEEAVSNGTKIRGFVPWVPVHEGKDRVAKCLEQFKVALAAAGHPEDYGLIKGVRYLFQNKPRGTQTSKLVAESINYIASQGLVYDVGVDMNGPECGTPGAGGLWQYEEFVQLLENTQNVVYIVNHLGKPGYGIQKETELDTDITKHPEFVKWASLIQRIASDSANTTFIKFSGAFDQLPLWASKDNETAVKVLLPWFKVIYAAWGPKRIMFGSDWPVCSLLSAKNTWKRWFEVVNTLLDTVGASETEKQAIFYDNCIAAYRV